MYVRPKAKINDKDLVVLDYERKDYKVIGICNKPIKDNNVYLIIEKKGSFLAYDDSIFNKVLNGWFDVSGRPLILKNGKDKRIIYSAHFDIIGLHNKFNKSKLDKF